MKIDLLNKRIGLLREFHNTVIMPLKMRYDYTLEGIVLNEVGPGKVSQLYSINTTNVEEDSDLVIYYTPREILHLKPDLIKGLPYHYKSEEEVSVHLMDEILYHFQHKEVDGRSKAFVQSVIQRARLTAAGQIVNELPDVDFGDEDYRLHLADEMKRSEHEIEWRFYNGLAGDPSFLLYGTYKGTEFVKMFNRNSELSLFLAKRKITKAVQLLSEYDDHNPYEPKIPSWWTFIKTKLWGNNGSI